MPRARRAWSRVVTPVRATISAASIADWLSSTWLSATGISGGRVETRASALAGQLAEQVVSAADSSSSEGLGGSGPAGSTLKFGRSANGSCSSSDTVACPTSAVVTPRSASISRWRENVGRRRSSSTSTTGRPVSAIACARSTATVVLPSPGTALVISTERSVARDAREVEGVAQDPEGLEVVGAAPPAVRGLNARSETSVSARRPYSRSKSSSALDPAVEATRAGTRA